MIKKDQPTIFNKKIIAAVSSVEDGQMQHGWEEDEDSVNANRDAFLRTFNLSLDTAVLVRVRYQDGATYDLIRDVDFDSAGEGMYNNSGKVADCLVTKEPGLGLFLPVADCGATIVYDPRNNVVALAHLGRHSTIADLALKLVEHMAKVYKSKPSDLQVWMSPSIKNTHYILETADFAEDDPAWRPYCKKLKRGFAIDFQGFNTSRFIKAGVQKSNVVVSEVDTADDENYWSHYTSKTVLGEKAPPRFAVVSALNTA